MGDKTSSKLSARRHTKRVAIKLAHEIDKKSRQRRARTWIIANDHKRRRSNRKSTLDIVGFSRTRHCSDDSVAAFFNQVRRFTLHRGLAAMARRLPLSLTVLAVPPTHRAVP